MIAVYIAGPLTTGDMMANIRLAVRAAARVQAAGMAPYVPHLSAFSEMIALESASYEAWMALDFEMLSRCDCLLRVGLDSRGADREVEFAIEHGIPVFYSVDGMLAAAVQGRIKERKLP
jgi:nucleoside 2-deoxyribosyltransferase